MNFLKVGLKLLNRSDIEVPVWNKSMCLASAKLLLLMVGFPSLSHYPLNLTARRFN